MLYSWRQLIASVNGVNDPAGAYQRYTGYMGKVEAQMAAFAKLSVAHKWWSRHALRSPRAKFAPRSAVD